MKTLLRDWRVRRLLLANITSSIGSGITIIAVPWLLVQHPDGDRLYGYVTVAATIVLFAFMPYYGVWLDRHSRKFALLAGESFGATVTLLLAGWMMFTGAAATWQLLALYFCGMLYYTLHYPARFAFVQQIFTRDYYRQLIGLMEIQGQMASVFAGGLASVLLTHVPLWTILLIDAASYVISFFLQRTLPYAADHVTAAVAAAAGNAWSALAEGLRWLGRRPKFTVFIICTLTPFVAVMTGNYLFPIYVQEILHAPAAVYGRGEMIFACGALMAGLAGPRLVAHHSAANFALGMMALFICGLILLGVWPAAASFYLALLVMGLGNAGSRVARGTVLLHEVPNAIMGRVNVAVSAADRLMRTLMQFGAIYVVVSANAAWAFVGLFIFVALALALAVWSRRGLQTAAEPAGS